MGLKKIQLRKLTRRQKMTFVGCGVVGLLVLTLGVNALFLPHSSNIPGSRSNQSEMAEEPRTTVFIDSSPALVTMIGDPHCDGTALAKTTPYTCTLPDETAETVITAPKEIQHEGQRYAFVTWDGCSEGNQDKSICKLKFEKGKHYSLKATYEPAASSQGAPVSQPVAVACGSAPTETRNGLGETKFRTCTLQINQTPKQVVLHETFLGKQPTGVPFAYNESTAYQCETAAACETAPPESYEPFYTWVIAKEPTSIKLFVPQETYTKSCGIGQHICVNNEKYSFKRFNVDLGTKFAVTAEYGYVCDVDNPGPIVWGYMGGTGCKQ